MTLIWGFCKFPIHGEERDDLGFIIFVFYFEFIDFFFNYFDFDFDLISI